MTEGSRAKVGLLGLMLDRYDRIPDLKPAMAEFAVELVDTISPFAAADFPGVCNSRDQVDRAVARFEREGCDLLLVVLLTYAPSHIALPALVRTRLPILILNTQQLYAVTAETSSVDTSQNQATPGVQDLTNVLLRAGREFQIVTGHYRNEATLAELRAWCEAARVASYVRHARIGLIGYPMEGMGDFGVDETALLAQLGIEVHHIAMTLLAHRAKDAPMEEIARQMADDRQRFRVEEGITPEEHEAASRLEWALRQVMQEQGLHGFAAHFLAIAEDGWLDTLPFLAAAKLMGEGYGYGGEGDVTSAAAGVLMHTLAGAANFTEMFTIDFAGNAMLMMHMGEGNWQMARRDEQVHLLRGGSRLADLRVPPLLLAFGLEPGDATLVSLTTLAGGKLKLIVTEGCVPDFQYIPALRRPHYKFQPQGDLGDFLTRFSLVGGSHHQAMAYGHWAGTVAKIAALLDIDCVCV